MTRVSAVKRLSSVALLVAWMVSAVGAVVAPHADGLDVACGDVGLTATERAIGAASAVDGDANSHCDLCHLQRLVRGALASPAGAVTVVEATISAIPAHARLIPSGSSLQLPSRAPPRSPNS